MNDQKAGGQGGETVLVPISEIKVNPGWREARTEDIRELADSISEVDYSIRSLLTAAIP